MNLNRTNPLAFSGEFGYTVVYSGTKCYEMERRSTGVLWLICKVEQMFLGHFTHKIDDKGRFSIPAKFREELGTGGFLTQGFDGNLRLLSAADFQKLEDFVNSMNQADKKTRNLRRFLFANASRVEFDRNGRISVVKFLQDFAEIVNNGTAVIVGVGAEIEIWSPDNWDKKQAELQDPEQFGDLNITL